MNAGPRGSTRLPQSRLDIHAEPLAGSSSFGEAATELVQFE